MIHFQQPTWLYLLIPLFVFALWLGRAGRPSAVLHPSADLVRAAARTRRTRWGRLLPLLRWLAAGLFVVALARPSIQHRHVSATSSGVDIMLAVDTSGSMQARDMQGPDGPASRLDAAKDVVGRFVGARPDDRIGLIAFAGHPYLMSPLTLEHPWVLERLSKIGTSPADDGTAVGSAIASAVRRLDAQHARSKILVLLTDGQNNAGKIAPAVAAEAARALGVKIYTIALGSAGEALVPLTDDNGEEKFVKAKVDVDEATLKKVAAVTGGAFYRATDTPTLRSVYAAIDRAEKTTRTIKAYSSESEQYAWFAAPGLLLLLSELALSATRFRRVPG
jgi:Ca-activated chloride channel family protein